MYNILGKLYDNRRSDSLAANLRSQRIALFKSLITSIPAPLRILDIGGTQSFWEHTGFLEQEVREIEIIVTNISTKAVQVTHPKFKSLVCDARNMKQFTEKEFDIVFSNSVIEHVGDYSAQRQMANEVMRVGRRYFIQTPSLYFPIEPHFVFPLFQFLPLEIRAWLINHFDLGWYEKITNKQEAMELVSSIRLLSKKEVIDLFPDGNVIEEKIFGLTKSFIACGGWDNTSFPLKQ